MALAVAASLLCATIVRAQQPQPLQCPSKSGNMPDLGYCEPDWYPIPHGQAWDPAIVPNEDIQTWGAIQPGQQQASLCKWFPPEAGSQPGARGTCKTDISWIISSANIRKSLFDSQMMNYILRFQLYGACYRSTQVCLLSRAFALASTSWHVSVRRAAALHLPAPPKHIALSQSRAGTRALQRM